MSENGKTFLDRLRHALAVYLLESAGSVERFVELFGTEDDFHVGQDFNYLIGNTLYGPARRSKKNSVTYGKYVGLFHINTLEMIEGD